ncbi:augmin complex subunit dgt3 isoform X2 [Orussus abietinus]|uniref:augmin complex subunit dgt3 isoform X2 n=1 Tax=Orussus abietinus TaxID=222816 RepID=UPI000C715C72|nr:augmin complex subunit dgt3 isoform X2 [Orussus abietinus]
MSISNGVLHEKIRELLPGLSPNITPQILNKLCEDDSLQPFLQWFCENVTRDNVLTEEEVQIRDHLQKTEQWLQGTELDEALAEATSNCPQLLELVKSENWSLEKQNTDLEVEKEAHGEDVDYLHSLETSFHNLKELEEKLDENLEEEQTMLKKDRIELDKAYNDCEVVLEKFDTSHRNVFKDVKLLVDVYANAAEKKGPQILYTQMPLELFIKKMEMYVNYLLVYIKRQFGSDSDLSRLMNDSKDTRGEEMLQELSNCEQKLMQSTVDEVLAKTRNAASSGIKEYAISIYNNGKLKIPQTQAQLSAEILELTGKRDYLEENVGILLEEQLKPLSRNFARMEITKIILKDAEGRLQRRKDRLEKLRIVKTFAREHGSAYSDLLSMLMKLQCRRLAEIREFAADAHHYLTTEYSLSTMRRESMQKQQNEYTAILEGPVKNQNVFNKIFMSMILGKDSEDATLHSAINQYDALVVENKLNREFLLGAELNGKIASLKPLEDAVTAQYEHETQDGVTVSLKSSAPELLTRIHKTTSCLKKLDGDLMTTRNKLKEMMKKYNIGGFERDSQILWQYFLADPEMVQLKYNEAKVSADRSVFANPL